jgi:preprotein translocase subunit SecY
LLIGLSYFGLILLFSSFYSTIVLNPKDISDQLQKMAVTIPGIRPGIQTTFYLKQVMKRVTLLGATMLAIIVTIPNFHSLNFKYYNFKWFKYNLIINFSWCSLRLSS